MTRFYFLLLFLFLCAPVLAAPVSLRLGIQGEIPAWLVLGPLPNEGTPHDSCPGFDRDFLTAVGGETGARPVEGAAVTDSERSWKWTLALCDENAYLNFITSLRFWGQSAAYASAEIDSPREQNARLLLGSDDGLKVWVNGELRHTVHVRRGVTRDEDKLDIRLAAGRNRLLVKVDQGVGEWGLVARLVNPDGSPARDLTVVLDIAPVGENPPTDTGTLIRRAVGKSGSLDVQTALRYQQLRRKVEPWLKRFRPELKNTRRLDEPLRLSVEKIEAACRKDAGSMSDALAAAYRDIEKGYTLVRNDFIRNYSKPDPLFKTDVHLEDYVRVAPGGRYFVHADGKPFTPIGYNHNPDWTEFHSCNTSYSEYNPQRAEEFFARLKKTGVNVLRMMIEVPGSGFFIENPIGTFSPEHIRWIDHLVTFARKYDVKLLLTPWDTFWMNHRWDICPYNSALGGPVVQKPDFINKREIREMQKKRLKFIIDRWGNLGVIFAWDLLNEADLWWEAGPEATMDWAAEMTAFVRDYEKKKWGRNHLVTVSIARAKPEGKWAEMAFRQPGFDFANTHLYLGAVNAPDEPVGPAISVNEGVSYALNQITDNRPYLDSESGPINRWIADGALDDAVFHNMCWSHLASGGAGSSMRWPYRHPHHLSDGMFDSLSKMARFCERVPWLDLISPALDAPGAQAPGNWLVYSTGSKKAAILWAVSEDGKPCEDWKLQVNWHGSPQKIRCLAFDTHSGSWISRKTITVLDGKFLLEISDAPNSVAVILEGVEK